jgi:prepilin-type N-terminal cleavage/methylation domain-containing protein
VVNRAPCMSRAERGFSLVEILITMTLVTILSVVALNALGPWLTFKQTLDTDRKLQDIRQALLAVYESNAKTIESQAPRTFNGLVHDTAAGGTYCASQEAALATMSQYLTESSAGMANDGFASPLCFFVTPQLVLPVEGVRIYYRMVAVVSGGKDGTLDAGTAFNATTGQLTLGGDDRGVVVNGYSVQYKKYRETLERMNRVASLYESYFTTRFMNTADRDVSRDYFYNSTGIGGDAGGSVNATSTWTPVVTALGSSIGVSPVDGSTAFETADPIEVGNHTETVTVNGQTTSVRSPASLSTGATPPYTALLRAKLPGPADNYVVRVVVGNY